MLLASMILSVSCSKGGDDAVQSTEPYGETTSETTVTEAETQLTADLPEMDFEGREFRVAVKQGNESQMWVETQNGEVTNDAVYERNSRIKEKYNTNITVIPLENDGASIAMYNAVKASVLADDDAYDLVVNHVYRFDILASANVLQNWRDVEYIDFDKPWWNKSINDKATYNDTLLGLTGTLAMTYLQRMNSMFFNMTLAETYGYTSDELYAIVNDGKWTLDSFGEILKPMYNDVNGNGEADDDDSYGLVMGYQSSHDVWTTAFNIPITGKDDDGRMTIEFINDKTVSALEKVNSFVWENDGVYDVVPPDGNKCTHLINNKTVFLVTWFRDCFSELRDMEEPYGILPIPKYDEEQDSYATLLGDGYDIFALPKTVSDLEFVGIITEAMAADTYNNVYPVYLDTALKSKYSEDEATAQMVDLIVNSADFDISYMFGVYYEMLPYTFRQLVLANSNDLMSKWASIENKVLENMDKMYEFYELN